MREEGERVGSTVCAEGISVQVSVPCLGRGLEGGARQVEEEQNHRVLA